MAKNLHGGEKVPAPGGYYNRALAHLPDPEGKRRLIPLFQRSRAIYMRCRDNADKGPQVFGTPLGDFAA